MFDKKCFGRFHPPDHLTDQMAVNESGFDVKFLNGYIVRVEWGPGYNCDNHHERPKAGHWWSSTNAEVAVYHSQKMRSIHAWQTEDQVRAIIDETSKLPDEDQEIDDEDCCCRRSACSVFVRKE
jgi:hypothetical protein